MIDDTTVRRVTPAEFRAAAVLRWRSEYEREADPPPPSEDYVSRFAQWAAEHADTHHCMIAVRGDSVLGAAWLALTPRVPIPPAFDRRSGDVQSVYVLPAERGRGLGDRLVGAVLKLAAELGVGRVTVHSGSRAVEVYRRRGFASSPHLLQVDVIG
ncbi:GNAT family N-acetyltransferase [Catellatospora methionotrophica]|uniref:GNAT family N-acetyltransferase n=1 Tax=Catellatospora methionotrophica TaxID=121620 RepID=UPI00340382F7